jgi:hypothetical protein
MSGRLIPVCNAKVMLVFHKSVVTELAAGPPQKRMDWVRKAQVDARQRAGVTRSAPS